MEVRNDTTSGPRGFTILYQILLTMLVIAMIPLGGLWYISIYKAKENWTANIYQTLTHNTESLAHQVDQWTAMNLLILEQNGMVPDVKSMEGARQNPVLKTITESYKWVYLAFSIGLDGENVGRSDGTELKFYGDREYFKQVISGKGIGQQVLLGKTSGKPAFILAKPIVVGEKKTVGVLAIAMTLEDLSATVTNTSIGKTGYAILVDDQNRLIARGQGAITNELQDMSNHPALKKQDKIDQDAFIFEYEGKEIVAYTYKTKLGWQLIVQQDAAEAYSAAEQAKFHALLLFGITLAVVLVIAYLLAKQLSTPIRNLTLIAEEISKGNLGAEIQETGRNDEIGALARAIARMGVSLQMAFDRLRKKT